MLRALTSAGEGSSVLGWAWVKLVPGKGGTQSGEATGGMHCSLVVGIVAREWSDEEDDGGNDGRLVSTADYDGDHQSGWLSFVDRCSRKSVASLPETCSVQYRGKEVTDRLVCIDCNIV